MRPSLQRTLSPPVPKGSTYKMGNLAIGVEEHKVPGPGRRQSIYGYGVGGVPGDGDITT